MDSGVMGTRNVLFEKQRNGVCIPASDAETDQQK